LEIGIGANDLINDAVRAWLEESLAVSSKDLGWNLEKYFAQIKNEWKMVNLASRVIDVWTQWNATKTKYGPEYVLEDQK